MGGGAKWMATGMNRRMTIRNLNFWGGASEQLQKWKEQWRWEISMGGGEWTKFRTRIFTTHNYALHHRWFHGEINYGTARLWINVTPQFIVKKIAESRHLSRQVWQIFLAWNWFNSSLVIEISRTRTIGFNSLTNSSAVDFSYQCR